MKKYFWLVAMLFSFALSGYAQPSPDDQAPHKPLGPAQLSQEKWYESMEEALAEPEKVYKLSLVGNKMKKLPPEIGQLVNLQVLNLSENKLKTLPEEIKSLRYLEVLSLYRNKLKYLPIEFRELSSLSALYLGRNKLTAIPVWVGGIGKLRRLDISMNPITPLEVAYVKRLLPRTDITY